MADKRIYLDNNATTALDPFVLRAMHFDLCAVPRNPSSIHSFGREARNELIKARRTVASALGVSPEEIFFSSGGSESNNFLTKGFLREIFPGEVITTRFEHSTILKNVEEYAAKGGKVTYLTPGPRGAPLFEEVEKAIGPDTALLIFMAVNNETGVETDWERLAALASVRRIPFIVDGVALLGKKRFTVPKGVTAMSFSGHKLHAPKGIGVTYLSSSGRISPLIIGGGQESGLRAGTHNLAGIIGMAKAVELLEDCLPFGEANMERLRNLFEGRLQSELQNVLINGEGKRICNTSNLAFTGIDGEALMMALDMNGLAASHGSACSSGSLSPSKVLGYMGYSKDRVASSLRFSLCRHTTEEEIERAVDLIVRIVRSMPSL